MSAWLFAWAYGAAALACLLRGLQRGEGIWLAASAILCLLGLAQAARLDAVLTAALRSAAWSGGWYRLRRPAQAAAMVVGAAGLLLAVRPLLSQPLLAAGLSVCLGLAWTRLVSLHQLDSVLGWRLLGVSCGRWIELAGLLLVLAALLWPGMRRV